MSTLSKLFSGYTGGGQIAKNGKFSTTKNNHNRDRYNRPTIDGVYSIKFLKLYFGKHYEDYCKGMLIPTRDCFNNIPSYMNPVYHKAYHQPKRKY